MRSVLLASLASLTPAGAFSLPFTPSPKAFTLDPRMTALSAVAVKLGSSPEVAVAADEVIAKATACGDRTRAEAQTWLRRVLCGEIACDATIIGSSLEKPLIHERLLSLRGGESLRIQELEQAMRSLQNALARLDLGQGLEGLAAAA